MYDRDIEALCILYENAQKQSHRIGGEIRGEDTLSGKG